MSPRISITHVKPPIPTAKFDYMASYEDEDPELRHYGWGRTPEEAVIDLIEEYPRPRGYPDCFDKDQPFIAAIYRAANLDRIRRSICVDGWMEWQRQVAA